jgi:plastocyanin
MTLRRRYLWPVAVVSAVVVILPAVAGSETGPAIEAVNKPGGGLYGEETHAWSPTAATVSTGGTVTLSNHTAIEHGVHWVGGPEIPGCSGIPVGTTSATRGANWSGNCTFTKPGTYTFYCTVHGPEMTGTITVKAPGTPIVTTEGPTELTHATARLNGAVNPEGNAAEYRFDYGTSTVSEHMTSTLSLGSADFSSHFVSAALTGLTPGAEYHVQLVAIYGVGKTTVLGSEQTFTTPVPAVPTVATGQATGLRETEATLKGTVDPNEGEETEYSFDYGTSSSYGQSTELKSLSTDRLNHTVSAALIKLAPGTEYHFRLVAHNKVGPATDGEDHTFTTASPAAPPGETPSSQPPTSGTPGTVGTLSPGTPDLGALAPPPPAGPIPIVGSPLAGGSHALTLATSQHGQSLHGSIDVSAAGAGGRLEVALFAPGASLAAVRHPAGVRVGRLLRSSVRAGIAAFAVPLTARGRAALHRHHRLALTAQIVLIPVTGAPVSVTRSVVLRG